MGGKFVYYLFVTKSFSSFDESLYKTFTLNNIEIYERVTPKKYLSKRICHDYSRTIISLYITIKLKQSNQYVDCTRDCTLIK